MAGLKEIQSRLKSVKNTRKITYAMKLVSAAKLGKAQEWVTRSREYTSALTGLLNQLVAEAGASEFSHPLMESHPAVRNVRLLVLGGNRGLCGGFNTNTNKEVEAAIKRFKEEHPEATIESVVVGKKPAEYYRRNDLSFINAYEEVSENAIEWPVDEICQTLELEYEAGAVDEVHMIYTRFRSAISQQTVTEQLLPFAAAKEEEGLDSGAAALGITLFEPSAREVFGAVIPRILRSRVRQAALDTKASEHGARMTAMDSATKNAGELINKLRLTYNRLRQSNITSELLDIIGGAEAIS